MSTLRFEPIATQVGKLTSPSLLFPDELLAAISRGEVLSEADPAWSPALIELLSHYAAVIEMAHLLLGAPPFDRLARLYDALKQEYMPEGELPSPVYDSHLAQHVLGGVPQGLAGETPLGVLARLSRGDAARARLQALAQHLAAAHPDLYRVERASGREAAVAPIRGGAPVEVEVTDPSLRAGDLLLARVVTFGGRCFIVDPPYLLLAPEQDWLDYLERAAAAGAAEPSPPEARAERAQPRLTSKQAARRRKERRDRAARNAPSERIVRHLRQGSSERFWLDYVRAACAESRDGLVCLAGVPDRPETLPLHPEYTGPELDARPEA